MNWCDLESRLVWKGGVRAKSEMHLNVGKQVRVSKCKLASASISVSMQVSKCQYPSVSEQFPCSPSKDNRRCKRP